MKVTALLLALQLPTMYGFFFDTPPSVVFPSTDSPDNYCHCNLPNFLTGDWTSKSTYGTHKGTFAVDYESGIFKKTEVYDNDGDKISDLFYFHEGFMYKSFPNYCRRQRIEEYEDHYNFSSCVPTYYLDHTTVDGKSVLTFKRNRQSPYSTSASTTEYYKVDDNCKPLSINMTTTSGSYSYSVLYKNIQVKSSLSKDFLTKDHPCVNYYYPG